MHLNRLKVGLRTYLAFGVLGAVCLTVAAFGIYQFTAVGTQIDRMTVQSGSLERLLRSAQLFEVMRRAQLRHAYENDAASLKERADAEAEIRTLLARLTHDSDSAERRQIYADVTDALHAQDEVFIPFAAASNVVVETRPKLFAGGDELTAVTNKLVAAVHAKNDPALSDAAGRVESAVLLVRVANWRFLATRDPKGPAVFQTNAQNATAALTAFGKLAGPDEQALATAVSVALSTYATEFAAISNGVLTTFSLFNEKLRPQIFAMQDKLHEAAKSFEAEFALTSADSNAAVSNAARSQEILAGVALLLVVGLSFLVGRSIVRPMVKMTAAMTKLANGQTEIEIPGQDGRDEIADMAKAVDVFRKNALANADLAAEQEVLRSAKDRRQASIDRHTQDFGVSISGVMSGLVTSSDEMRKAALAVGDLTQRTRESVATTAQGAAESSRNLSSVASAAEEMSASIAEIAKQVVHVTSAVRETVDRATETDTKVAGLAEAGRKIGDVVRLITNIAEQTNLLALNATIEAARAGDAGRGFAVVAGEVKALAAQTARATEEIGAQIVAIRDSTTEAVDAVREVGSAIGRIDTVAAAIAAAVEEQAIATREIAASVQSVSVTTDEAARAMQEVSTIAAETEDNSRAMIGATDGVGHTADTLRKEVDFFLQAVSQTEENNRRRYERIPGKQNSVVVTADGTDRRFVIEDISRGGFAVRSDWTGASGKEVHVVLPGSETPVSARIVRASGGVIAFSFRQDGGSLTEIDRALDIIGGTKTARAA